MKASNSKPKKEKKKAEDGLNSLKTLRESIFSLPVL